MLDHVFARSQRQIHGPNKFPIWWCVLMFAQLKQMPRVQIQSGVDSQLYQYPTKTYFCT